MTQVIIFTNESGGVSVCIPTGELSINEVLTRDCPVGAIIVDDSIFPQGADIKFFDAWVLNGSTITVDMDKAKTIANNNLNNIAKLEVSRRTAKIGIGLTNVLSDADWLALLSAARTAINSSTTTQNLLDAITPVEMAILANV